MNTANDDLPLRVIAYPPTEKNNPRFLLIIHGNPSYAKEVLDKYTDMLAECIDTRQDIKHFFMEKGLGFVWGDIILGAATINSSRKITEYGDTKISMGFVKFGNERCPIKDVSELTSFFSIHQNLSLLKSFEFGKIKDVLWYLLIGVSTYYSLTELIKIIF